MTKPRTPLDETSPFWQKLIPILDAEGMTQTDLMKAANVSSAAMQKWKNGKSKPTYANLRRISRATNRPISDFMDEDDFGDDGGDEADVVERYLASEFGEDTSPRTAEILRSKPFRALRHTPVTVKNVHQLRELIDSLSVSRHSSGDDYGGKK